MYIQILGREAVLELDYSVTSMRMLGKKKKKSPKTQEMLFVWEVEKAKS